MLRLRHSLSYGLFCDLLLDDLFFFCQVISLIALIFPPPPVVGIWKDGKRPESDKIATPQFFSPLSGALFGKRDLKLQVIVFSPSLRMRCLILQLVNAVSALP